MIDDMKKFFTRENATDGIQLPLYAPGSEVPTEHWIRIRGVDSDEFKLADIECRRKLRDRVAKGETPGTVHLEEMRFLIASLVMDWSFDEPVTYENVVEFLRQAPQVQEVINQAATKRNLFTKKGSDSSVSTPELNSN